MNTVQCPTQHLIQVVSEIRNGTFFCTKHFKKTNKLAIVTKIMKKTQKPKPKICENCSSKCAYDCTQLQYTLQHRTDLIIFPLTLQTIITARTLSIGEAVPLPVLSQLLTSKQVAKRTNELETAGVSSDLHL